MNGSGPPNVEHSLMSALHSRMGLGLSMLNTASCLHCMGCSHPQDLLTQADLIPSPDDGLNSYSSPQLSVVGVTTIEAYGGGYSYYVAIDFPLTLQSTLASS
jgi:hypothetical protein